MSLKDTIYGVVDGPFWAPTIENVLRQGVDFAVSGEAGPQDRDVWVIQWFRKGDSLTAGGDRVAAFDLADKAMAEDICLRLNQKDEQVRSLDIYQKIPWPSNEGCPDRGCPCSVRCECEDRSTTDVYELDGRSASSETAGDPSENGLYAFHSQGGTRP